MKSFKVGDSGTVAACAPASGLGGPIARHRLRCRRDSGVSRQPRSGEELHRAGRALVRLHGTWCCGRRRRASRYSRSVRARPDPAPCRADGGPRCRAAGIERPRTARSDRTAGPCSLTAEKSALAMDAGTRFQLCAALAPVHGRQMPAKKNDCPSARSNQRHSFDPLGVFLSGSAKADAGTTQRCSRSSQSRHSLLFRVRKWCRGRRPP
jgi:hypothetical protein